MENRLERLKKRLDMYYEVEEAILAGAQSYKIATREYTRASLTNVKDTIKYLENEIEIEKSKQAGRGRNRTMRVTPRDL